MTELKPCPFCGMTVHWKDGCGIIHDKVVVTCIVDLVCPTESNMHIPKEMWIKKWNMRTGMIEPVFSRKEKVDLKPCPFCGSSDLFIYELSDGIRCNNCMAKITDCEDWKDRWNKRVNE